MIFNKQIFHNFCHNNGNYRNISHTNRSFWCVRKKAATSPNDLVMKSLRYTIDHQTFPSKKTHAHANDFSTWQHGFVWHNNKKKIHPNSRRTIIHCSLHAFLRHSFRIDFCFIPFGSPLPINRAESGVIPWSFKLCQLYYVGVSDVASKQYRRHHFQMQTSITIELQMYTTRWNMHTPSASEIASKGMHSIELLLFENVLA